MKLCQQMIDIAYTTHADDLSSKKIPYFIEISWTMLFDGKVEILLLGLDVDGTCK